MKKLLLVDDDERLAELLDQYFQRFQLSLESATHPSLALQQIEKNHYDLLILDIMLPEMDGFELCKIIRKEHDTPIIMLTARGEVMDRIIGLELGADDYLAKPFEPRELVARIQNVLKRQQPSHPHKLYQFGGLVIDPAKLEASINGQPLQLSTMEYQLLTLFAKNVNQTLHRDDILNHLKGVSSEILTRSVDILVSRLRQKLAPLELIKTIRGSGYLFIGENQ